ncbi:MAG: leucine-rich repeat protein [Clostridia bacterium]|nr:leucine-rich repeat protein [Clostridia bacterium]
MTTIHGWSFTRRGSIEELVISENINTIDSGAFQECCFSSVTLPISLKTIESSAFRYNARLKTINLMERKSSGTRYKISLGSIVTFII